jgi:ribosome-associated heat shock protein Hsp15
VNGSTVKPSRSVRVGDVIGVKRSPVLFSFKVLALAENRMGAKLVPGFMENVTTPDQLELFELGRIAAQHNRDRGTGRPTKKERRDLDDFMQAWPQTGGFEVEDDEGHSVQCGRMSVKARH